MNKCDKYESLCSLYIDDMLLNTEVEDLLEHLDTCDNCHNYYIDLKRTKDSLKNLKIEYPEDLSSSILDKIQQNKEVQIVQYSPPRRKALYAILASCACFAIIVSSSSFNLPFSNTINSTTDMSTAVTTMSVERSSSTSAEAPEDTLYTGGSETTEAEVNDAGVNTLLPNTVAQGEMVEEDVQLADKSEVVEEATNELTKPEFSRSELLLDDYAFVYEFEGDKNIGDIDGKILYLNETSIYLEVENTISIIESIVTVLEDNDYELLQVDQNEFRISTEANSGIFIIHTN